MSYASVKLQLLGDWKTSFGVEGFYSNRASAPTDLGGETIAGISRVKNPDAAVWAEVDRLKAAGTAVEAWAQDAGLAGAVDVFYKQLWAQHDMDYLPELLQGPIFGGIVNQGVQVVIDLQECLQLMGNVITADGQMGPATLALVAKVAPQVLATFLKWRRTTGYLAVVDKHPEQLSNFHGWICRLAAGL